MTRKIWTKLAIALALAAAQPFVAFAQPAPVPAAAAPADSTPAPAPASARSSGDRDYILGVGDTIDVAVLGRSDFNGRAKVGTDGNVLLPFLGTITAMGKSPAQLAEDVRIALEKGGYYAAPVVRVDISGVASRFITVLGAVGSPGLIPLDRQYRLSEIVARAGGRAGSGADYLILTHENGKSAQYKFAELATGTGDKDPPVANGDKIYVPAVENEVFYISGQVKQPGAYPASQGMTLRMALARGGGLGEMGSEKKVKINRKGENLKDVKMDTTTVEPGDVITVGERLF